MKKLYKFIYKHFVGFIRFWTVCLIPCAFSKHFALWMLTANLVMYMLLLCGQHKGWNKED